jgi:hypothetical protein
MSVSWICTQFGRRRHFLNDKKLGSQILRTRVFIWLILFGFTPSQILAISLPLKILQTALVGRAENILRHDIPSGAIIATRDLTNSALVVLAADGEVSQAQQLLALAFSVQNMNPTSPTYGSFPWYYNSDAVTDGNADDFTSQALGPIWLHYGHLFPPSPQKSRESRSDELIAG